MPLSGSSPGFWQSVARLPDRTSLRIKLVSSVLVLVAVALTIISFAGISFLKSYLLGTADDKLQALIHEETFAGFQIGPSPQHLPGLAVIWIPNGGTPQQLVIPVSVSAIAPHASEQVIAGPRIPANPSSLPSSAGKAITVPATSGSGKWRIVGRASMAGPGPDGSATHGTLVLATDVSSVYSTIGRLTGIDLTVSAIVILGLAIVGVALVRASLRPLTDIERTAEDIAAGDLTRRVPDRDPRTEVGRLGRSLNAMLAQVETAFRARTESEEAARRSEEAAKRSAQDARRSAYDAHRSEERMRQFVADASHELRTPLTAIRGFAEYYRQRGGVTGTADEAPAKDTAPSGIAPIGAAAADSAANGIASGTADLATGQLTHSDLDRIIQRVEQEAARMGILVDDLLLLARLDQQRPLEFRTVDMLAIAADALHDARVIAPKRAINLTVDTPHAPLVLGEEVRLRQVVGNLMSNAMTHTPGGTPIEITIRSGALGECADPGSPGSAGNQPPAGTHTRTGQEGLPARQGPAEPAVILEVADQGPGLSDDQIEHVFERLYRTDRARTRTAGGTGLGLAIVAALVAAHHGRVWVNSAPSHGATFGFALPLAPEVRLAEPDQPRATTAADRDP